MAIQQLQPDLDIVIFLDRFQHLHHYHYCLLNQHKQWPDINVIKHIQGPCCIIYLLFLEIGEGFFCKDQHVLDYKTRSCLLFHNTVNDHSRFIFINNS